VQVAARLGLPAPLVHTVSDHAAGAGPGGRLRRRLEVPNRAGRPQP